MGCGFSLRGFQGLLRLSRYGEFLGFTSRFQVLYWCFQGFCRGLMWLYQTSTSLDKTSGLVGSEHRGWTSMVGFGVGIWGKAWGVGFRV